MVGDQNSAWSVGLGSWYGVSVRLHMLFFVFAVMTFYFGWHAAQSLSGVPTPAQGIADPESGMLVGMEYYLTAISALGILLVSIFIHEVAHGFTATGCGGTVESIEVFPWGGSSQIDLPADKRHQFLVHVSGPLANLFVCGICALLLLFDPEFSRNGSWGQLIYPLQPEILQGEWFTNFVALVFWINWLIVLINLLPVSPFDGGRIVRSLIPLLWPNTRTDQVYLGSMIVAMMTSIGLCVVAWVVRETEAVTLVPMWLVLILLAIVVFFGARRQTQLDLRDLEDLLQRESHDYGGKILDAIENRAFDEFDEDENDHEISDWLYQHKFDFDEESESDREDDDEEMLDEILARINDVGLEGLTEYERYILLRASAKFRRQRHGEHPSDMTSN